MTDTQKYLLDFIKYFDGFCRENGIEYFLGGGSMLGAIRHKGFLPWDDDLDLYIKGSEWERARDIFLTKLPERYKVVCMETHPNYHNTIIRIADTRTSAFYKSRLADDTPHGVQIELFRLDPMPDDPEEKKKFYNDYWAYYEAENPYIVVMGASLDNRKLSFEDFRRNVRLFDSGDKAATDRLEAELYKWDENSTTLYHEGWGTYWIEYPVKAFEKQLYVPFEDTMLPVASGFADALYGEYGDTWMELPSKANQAFHDDFEDYDIPYIYMEKDIASQVDRKPYLKAYKERKRTLVERAFQKAVIKREKLRLEDQYLSRQFNNEANREFCRQAFERGDYPAVLDRMTDYIDKQWDGFSNHFLYTMDSDLMYEIVYSSFMTGELKFIDRIRRDMDEEPEPRIAEIFRDLVRLRAVRFSYYYDTMDEQYGDFKDLFAKYPSQIHLRILDIIYRMRTGSEPAESILAAVRKLLEFYGPVHRLRKLEADLTAAAGDSAAAEELYRNILETSNDGMVNNEIKDILEK